MNPLKALGPDGLPSLLFQKLWHIVGADVSAQVLEVLNDNKDPIEFNETHIARQDPMGLGIEITTHNSKEKK